MIDVSTRANDDGEMDGTRRGEPDSIATVESYETDGSVVFYDAQNPLAWVETTRSLRLEEVA